MQASLENKSKTALVLAGGGLTGAVYEIGALRAIDDLLINRSVSEFDAQDEVGLCPGRPRVWRGLLVGRLGLPAGHEVRHAWAWQCFGPLDPLHERVEERGIRECPEQAV